LAFPEPLERLVAALERLPGIGPRSAERIALHVLRSSTDDVAELAVALRDARMQTQRCTTCGNVTLDTPCSICADKERDSTSVCVVEGPREVAKMESAGVHDGIYHVLLDGYAPREGAEPDPSALQALRRRVDDGLVHEIILATAPDREGEGAAALVLQALDGTNVSITHLARGVPSGAKLEYLHSEILAEAYRGRRKDG